MSCRVPFIFADNFMQPKFFNPLFMFFALARFVEPGYAQSKALIPRSQVVVSNGLDTVSLTIDSAESRFLKANYLLIAQRYQVEATKALVLQARLWPNPNITGSILIHNTKEGRNKILDFSTTGEQSYQIGQLINIAGKQRNQIQVAKLNTLVAEDQFYDLIRTLKLQLRTDFYTIYYDQQSLGIYDQEIKALTQTINAYQQLVKQGFIAKKEILRIQAQLYALQNELIALKAQIAQTESDLNILLAENDHFFMPQVDTSRLEKLSARSFSIQALNDTALANRYDLKSAAANLESSRYGLKLQRSLAVPNPTIGYSFDRNGSYVYSSRFLSLGIDIPIFNRNQGNIQNARFAIQNNEAQLSNQQKVVLGDVFKAYNAAIENERLAQGFDPSFAGNYTTLVQEVLKNYQIRNIGLLDFLNYYDSYKQNVLQSNTLRLNRILAYEQINFAIGKDIIK